MKHNLKITLVIIVMFLISMLIGLAVVHSYDVHFGKTSQKIANETNVTIENPDVSIIRGTVPPPMEIKRTIDVVSILLSIIVAIAIAVILFFIFSKIRVHIVLKIWFIVVVFICLTIAFTMIFYSIFGSGGLFNFLGKKVLLAEFVAVILAIILTIWKVKRNVIAHNFTELFIYSGIAVIFVPILNVLAASILLILISIYDMIAVWKTKHMQALAKFQMEEVKIFTGFLLPYVNKKDKVKIENIKIQFKKIKSKKKKENFMKKQKIKVNLAILGGGDVAFPLIFIGTILLTYGFAAALIVSLTTMLALTLLLFLAKKGRFYPAMPFLSAGCFLGLLLVLI